MTDTATAPKRMTQAKLDAQGGEKKGRGFWKEESTLAVLKRVGTGDADSLTVEQAADLLKTTSAAVTFYLRERGFTKSAPRQRREAAGKETPLPHGSDDNEEKAGGEDDVPF